MSYTIVISDTAKEDLREIAVWLAKQFKDIDVTKHFVNELRDRCNEQKIFPQLGLFQEIMF